MPDADDMELMREFAQQNSEAAFAELVRRHINLVYSVARRCTGNDADAQDVTQAVFIILARKANGMRAGTLLPGWLYETTRFTASRLLRSRERREQREQEASMQSESADPDPLAAWQQLSPHLEAAMSRLPARDRALLVFRFYENKSGPEVAALLGIRAETAHKRVSRAIDKLRRFFVKNGVTLSCTAIAGAISGNSIQSAPALLGRAVSATAVAKGATAAASTLTLVKGALTVMAWTKTKMAAAVALGILLAAGATTAVVVEIIHPGFPFANSDWANDPKYWAPNSRVLDKIQPVMIIRPTHFPKSGGGIRTGNRLMSRNCSIQNLLDTAYGFAATRTVFPANMPTNSYDLMYTLPAPPAEALQKEMKKRFDYTARVERRSTDVLLLTIAQPNAPGLRPAQNKNSSSMTSNADRMDIQNQGISTLCWYMEGLVNQPVVDKTGLQETYDITLRTPWKWDAPSKTMLDHALLDQLGLKLVSTNMPIDVLVVEKTP